MLWGYNLTAEQKKIVLLSSLGGLLEFYDFTIYGLFATYFANQFFPSQNELISIIASYSIFVVGYIVRPVGGIIFSHIGDEIGRKSVLILTMILMGVASMGMGLIPTYAQIGIYAPALMLLLRLLQGLAIGGELPSMIVYIAESMPQQRGLGMGGVFSGTIAGLIPGMVINLLMVHYLTAAQISSFGWRIPFLLGGLLAYIAYRIRRELHETVAFVKLKRHANVPLFELLRHHLGKVIIGAGLVSAMATPIILAIIFMPVYLLQIIKLDPVQVSSSVLVAAVASVLAVYAMGIMANRCDIFKLMRNCLGLIVIAAAICYFMLAQHANLMLALTLFAVFQGFLVTLPPIFLSYLFPTAIRLTGVALSYNLSFVIFGGLTPIFVTGVINKTKWIFAAPMLALIIAVIYAAWALAQSRKHINLAMSNE